MWGESGARESVWGESRAKERERVCVVRVGQERERVCVCGPIHKYHVLFHQVVVVRDENILYFGKVYWSMQVKHSQSDQRLTFFVVKQFTKTFFVCWWWYYSKQKKGVEFKQVKIDSFLIKAMTTVNIYSLQEPRKGNIK